MNFEVDINNIQHVNKLYFSIDLSLCSIRCITGKSGVGKTTLIKAIRNLVHSDTFQRTASPRIFSTDSSIYYRWDTYDYTFSYEETLSAIDTKKIINKEIQRNISVELPIPHGDRFNHFQSLAEIDGDLRRSISLENYSTPTELLEFLNQVYGTNRFSNIKEVTVRKKKYYFILRAGGYYIREDYLSSGEFFAISLYKMIQKKCKLIVIDEIDISLDSSAQVNLVSALRVFCTKYEVNLLFTTHSLALMKTLNAEELFYMREANGEVSLSNISYNHIKSLLFGFKGWDRYIITEDIMLANYLEDLIRSSSKPIFSKYKIIYVGTAKSVIDVMTLNKDDEYLATPENIICILDGDQRDAPYCAGVDGVSFIPFESVEKQLKDEYDNGNISVATDQIYNHKNLYKHIARTQQYTDKEVFSLVNQSKEEEVQLFLKQLEKFLAI